MGTFSGAYNGIRCLLTRLRKKDDHYNVLTAGGIAGLAILFEEKSSHRTIALYLLARVIQCWYNYQKARGKWHFWGSNYTHGNKFNSIVLDCIVLYFEFEKFIC
jgi:hypothetical protein